MDHPNTTTSRYIQYVGALAAQSTQKLELVGETTKKLTRVFDSKVLSYITFVQESWLLPMGLTEENLKTLVLTIDKYDVWDVVFALYTKSRAGMELQSGHWESLIAALVNGLVPADMNAPAGKVLLGPTTLASFPKTSEVQEILKANPWLVTLVALNLADKIVGTQT